MESSGKRTGNSVQVSRTRKRPQLTSDDANKIESRSNRITSCLLCLVASVSCLSPFVSLHLTQRVGLLLFESDWLQLKASIFTVILCLLVLVVLQSIIFILRNDPRRANLVLQRSFRRLMGIFASISAVSYLAIVLLVPQIQQIQRLPIATFDCNANLITIENCQQQFSVKGGELTVLEGVRVLLTERLDGHSGGLIRRLDCLKYNDKELVALEVPTRFLLHNCGLVCKPQRQQLHQFSDDLNREQSLPQVASVSLKESLIEEKKTKLRPPYHPVELNSNFNTKRRRDIEWHEEYLNHSHQKAEASTSQPIVEDPSTSFLSLKVCFSDEFSGSHGQNYKQFCITNLANNPHLEDRTLTVGQLNAMLRKFMPSDPTTSLEHTSEGVLVSESDQVVTVDDQVTRYANPVVHFESHFKNWPHIPGRTRIETGGGSSSAGSGIDEKDEESWCKFKPLPPFIVNNKPFSDIQCSLEHEYTMTTGPPIDSTSFNDRGADRIYLKKSSADGSAESSSRERCNIQCKVNILYQVHKNRKTPSSSREDKPSNEEHSTQESHYYLPLKPCVIVSGDKVETSNYYLMFRSIGESTLVLVFILLDLFILIESISTKQSQFGTKKYRIVSLLVIIALLPAVVALLFDLASIWFPSQVTRGRRDGYLTSFLSEQIVPTLRDLFSHLFSSEKRKVTQERVVQPTTHSGEQRSPTIFYNFDHYMLPFFAYSICMFILTVNSFSLTVFNPSTLALARPSGSEQLGLTSEKSELHGRKRSGDLHEKKDADTAQEVTTGGRLLQKNTIMMISFYSLVLFMGIQFNLSQHTQTLILLDSFGKLGTAAGGQSFATSWFTFGTNLAPALCVLLMALLFTDEISTLLTDFSPFKSAQSLTASKEKTKHNRSRFLKYLSISLILYAIRFAILSNLHSTTRLKWLFVLLFQVTELFNFPLTWLTLTTRAHEIMIEQPTYERLVKQLTKTTAVLNVHLMFQSIMAFTYFAVARFVAIFAHSLYVSLYLHSDDVDWFVTSLHKPHSNEQLRHNETTANGGQQQLKNSPESVFSPLPGERQTYLHASRLFLQYDSILCLLIGVILLANLIYTRCQLWAAQKRTLNVYHPAHPSEFNCTSSIDERLSLDLMRINQSPTTKTIYPEAPRSNSRTRHSQESPQAKILFHYDLGRRFNSSSSSPDSASGAEPTTAASASEQVRADKRDELVIPIETETSLNLALEGKREVVEHTVRRHNKRIRYLEKEFRMKPRDNHGADYLLSSETETKLPDANKSKERKRVITFAPTTTLIGSDGGFSEHQIRQNARRASPEPSICEESDSIEDD